MRRDGEHSAAEDKARIERIVQEALSAWEARQSAHEDELAARHPELLPDLLESLRFARTVFLARQKAEAMGKENGSSGNESAGLPDDADSDSGYEDEVRFLKNHFPGFELLARIEHGGQGTVYKAVQLSTGRTVALKVLLDGPLSTPLKRERFFREVELISRLNHPNIVTIFQSGVVAGRPYFAMEYVEGLPIDDYVLLHRLSVHDCVRLFVLVCQAVSHAHQKGIIHRDLKPLNILVDLEGQPRILDFGLAKNIEEAGDSSYSVLSLTGQVFGTLPYMSPEQAAGPSQEVDVLSDVYALGVIFYRLLTGVYPYQVNGDPAQVRSNILHADPLTLSKALRRGDSTMRPTIGAIDDELDKIILKALSKEKSRRYQSVVALAEDLERYLKGEPVQAKAASNLYLFKKTLRRYRLQFTVAAAIACILAVSSVLVTYSWLRAAQQRDHARAVASVAHATFDDIATKMDESIRTLAGGTAVSNDLLESATQRLLKLQELVEADGGLEDIEAKIHEKRGDIAALQGRNAEARAHFEEVLKRSAGPAPAGTDPDTDITVSRRRLRIHSKLAGLREDDEEENYLEAQRIGRSLITQAPDDRQLLLEYASLLVAQATTLLNRRHHEATRQALQEVEARGIIATFRDSAILSELELLAAFYSCRGRMKGVLGDGAGYLADLENCLEIRRRLSEAHPTNIQFKHQLRLAYTNVAMECQGRGDMERSVALFGEAVRLGEYLVMVEPEVPDWRFELFRSFAALSYAFIASGKIEEAAHSANRALSTASELMERQDSSEEAISALANAYILHGRIHLSQSDLESVYAAFEESRRLYAGLAADHPDNRSYFRSLAIALDYLGQTARQLDARAAALNRYLEAYELRQDLIRMEPGSVDCQLDIITSLNKLTVWHLSARTEADDEAARHWMDETRDRLEELCRSDQSSGRAMQFDRDESFLARNRAVLEARRLSRQYARQTLPDTVD